MSSSATEFSLFSKLPAELRLLVWERVPQPVRVVGHLPCSTCWRCPVERGETTKHARRRCSAAHHPDWRLRYVVQPREHAIFPPLHACQESRRAWLPRYFCPPRHLNLKDYDPESLGDEGYQMRFDTPFLSYETDVFTVFDAWTRADFAEEWTFHGHSFDPFLGLDRTRIQHIAFCEITGQFLQAIGGLGIQRLPSLREISLLAAGPDPNLANFESRRWPEMLMIDVQHIDCELRDIPQRLLAEHPLFCERRLHHQVVELSPEIRPLRRYLAIFKAWLWHAKHLGSHEVLGATEDPWWDFLEYVLGSGVKCPLAHLTGCGVGGHSKREMLQWRPSFDINCMFVCEKAWMSKLDALSIFDSEPSRHSEAFIQLNDTRRAKPASTV